VGGQRPRGGPTFASTCRIAPAIRHPAPVYGPPVRAVNSNIAGGPWDRASARWCWAACRGALRNCGGAGSTWHTG